MTLGMIRWGLLAICASAQLAGASAVMFIDGFDTDPAGGGEASLLRWTATRGSVDVLSPGKFGIADHGQFLDMDGNSPSAGRLQSNRAFTLTPGTYTLSFDVAGSQRTFAALTDSMTVSLGDVFSTTVSKRYNEPFTTLSFPITVATTTTGNLVFDAAGADHVGLLLDNVILTSSGGATTAAAPVPVPTPAAAWTGLTTLGLLALIGGRCRRNKGLV